MRIDAFTIITLLIVAFVAFIGFWMVMGYDFSNGAVPEVYPGKAFLYPESMKITQEMEPGPVEIRYKSQGSVATITINPPAKAGS